MQILIATVAIWFGLNLAIFDYPVAAFTTLSASRVAPNLGSVRAQANHAPSPTLKQDEGLIDRALASACPNVSASHRV